MHLEYMRYYDKLNGANRGGEAAEQREDRRDPKRACRGTRPRVIVQGRPRLSKPFVTITGFIARISDLRLV